MAFQRKRQNSRSHSLWIHNTHACMHACTHIHVHTQLAGDTLLPCTIYGTAQFKLDSTYVQQGHDTTRFSFTCMQACVCMQDGDVKPTMQSFRVCTRHVHDARVHVRNTHAKLIVSQGQRNKLYKHVYVLRCNPPHDTRCKSC